MRHGQNLGLLEKQSESEVGYERIVARGIVAALLAGMSPGKLESG
jgi:hypothetical protein